MALDGMGCVSNFLQPLPDVLEGILIGFVLVLQVGKICGVLGLSVGDGCESFNLFLLSVCERKLSPPVQSLSPLCPLLLSKAVLRSGTFPR